MNAAINIAINKIIKNTSGAGEGCELTAYWDKDGKKWTVGRGCTGPDIKRGTTWTQSEADQALDDRLQGCFNLAIKSSPILLKATANQCAAIIDFIYNAGYENYINPERDGKISTLKKYIDAGNFKKASEEILKWNHSGGKVLSGLTKRCAIRSELLLS
jgi:lysozyme